MKPVYLDYQASTPVDPRVLERMLPLFTEQFGNPHSAQHGYGHEAAAAVESARRDVAALIHARPSEVFFTSGATEANNAALLGVARAHRGERRRIIVSAFEHPCVHASAERLGHEGFEVLHAPIRPDGIIDLDWLERHVAGALVVSVMLANNEVGTLAPMADIARLTRAAGCFLHTDAAQAAGKVPIDVDAMGIDLLSLTAHKFYGPKGGGALFVRARPDLVLEPLIVGGGQEHGVRSGTVATPLAVGLGEASRIALAEQDAEGARLLGLRTRMLAALTEAVPGLSLVGDPERRLPGNLNLCIPGVPAESLLLAMPGLALSSASACSAGGGTPSHVLAALGLAPEQAECCFRVGLGRYTTDEEVDLAVRTITDAARDALGIAA